MDPLTAIPSVFNTVIRIFEITYQLKAVDEQTRELLNTTEHVDANIHEARRLRRLKDSLLQAGERLWMDRVIEDNEAALQAVAHLIEPARVDLQTSKTINLKHRAVWVFRDNSQVRDKHARLSICHQSLGTVISCLYSRDVIVITPASEDKDTDLPPPYKSHMGELFGWRSKRRRLRDVRSSPTTTASKCEGDTIPENALYGIDSHLTDSATLSSLARFNSHTSSNLTDSTASVGTPSSYDDFDGLQACEDYWVGPSRKTSVVDLAGLVLEKRRPYESAQSDGASANFSMETTHDSGLGVDHTSDHTAGQSYDTGANQRHISSNDDSKQDHNSKQKCDSGLLGTSERGRNAGQSSLARRNSRSWFEYHAMRSDIGHSVLS